MNRKLRRQPGVVCFTDVRRSPPAQGFGTAGDVIDDETQRYHGDDAPDDSFEGCETGDDLLERGRNPADWIPDSLSQEDENSSPLVDGAGM